MTGAALSFGSSSEAFCVPDSIDSEVSFSNELSSEKFSSIELPLDKKFEELFYF